MRAVLRFLGSRWFLSLIGVALLAALVWLFGPFLSYLESSTARAEAIAAMVVIWGVVNACLSWRRRRKDKALLRGVTAAPVDPTVAASAEEAATMRDRLTTALALLKKAS